ncbi:unnamed protein product [Parnassius apollo]|uniref:(apollo) hypothetical protein n=1 Tax=Parnassius apollo TaxID=110799 RepID=A0A8S3WY38_PARAO|nr:unnamed protein product [Parnassius apollo]
MLKSTAISTSASSTPDLPTSDLANELKLLRQDIKEMRNDMQEFRGTMTNLLTAINACNQRLDCLEARMEVVDKNSQIKTSNDISFFEKTITDLKIDLNDRDQELLGNDIEVSGIPEDKNERSTHIVLAVATKLGVALEDRDIVSAERAGLLRREQNETSRPRPIVVQLALLVHRDSLLAVARVRRGCTTVGLGLNSVDCPFYVNERLTRHNRQPFYKVRTEAKRNNWKYVWTRQGKVFARRENGEPHHRVRFESDLIKVFGQ